MRLTAPVFGHDNDPDRWVQAHRDAGYSVAANIPGPDDVRAKTFAAAARKANLPIAEIGAWSNPMSPDAAVAKAAMEKCIAALAWADEVGARCCVNIAGSRGEKWDGPDPKNLSEETFEIVVETTRKIIDAVKPKRTVYALETMPWVWPDSPEAYLRILKAIDRPNGFAVHLDPVNMICTPRRAYDTAGFLRECFEKLGPWIRTAHAKDIRFTQHLTVHLDECRPGTGLLDYGVFVRELAKLDSATSLVVEHLPNEAEYRLAVDHIRSVAKGEGIQVG